MVYVDVDENEKMEIKKSFWKNLFFKMSVRFNSKSSKIIEEKIEDKIFLKLPNLQNKTLNKLTKYIKENCICIVCASDNLLNNDIFIEYIKNQNIKLLNGKWLFKMLSTNIVKYIAESKKEKMEYQEVSILSNKIDEIIVFTIRSLAERVKIINVLSNDSYKFKKIEKELYEKSGIIINLNNNYKKSLIKSDIILNFDFTEEQVNKYTLPKKACIMNFNDPININTKTFDGINANFYEISLPQKYVKNLLYLKKFNTSILYESFIYKNTNPSNIEKELEKDDVNITFLVGRNGKIRKNEYLKMSKKLVN